MVNQPSPEAPGGEVLARDNLRASHEDRDRVVEQLRVAGGDGRLDAEELDTRVEAALTARTYGELTRLVADLPAAGGGAARPKEVVRIDCGGGNARRDGHWAVPQRMEVKVRSGDVKLDFTDAQVTWPVLQIDAQVRSGNLTLITKPGIVVGSGNITARPPRRGFWDWLRRAPKPYAHP